MNETKATPRPLTLNGGWEQQVNSHAQRKKEAKRANHIMTLICLALALIAAGGIYINCMESVPIWLGVSVAVSGIAILSFMLGIAVGCRSR